jgi:hypothetical protein
MSGHSKPFFDKLGEIHSAVSIDQHILDSPALLTDEVVMLSQCRIIPCNSLA